MPNSNTDPRVFNLAPWLISWFSIYVEHKHDEEEFDV